jgi:hypothetical protein
MAFMFTCTDYSPAKFSYHDLNSEIEWKKQRKKKNQNSSKIPEIAVENWVTAVYFWYISKR